MYQYAPVLELSPVTGVVSGLEVTEGTQVTKGERLASVTDPAQLRLTVEIPALDLSYFASLKQGEFHVGGEDTKTISAKITGLSPFVDPATGTATCELEVGKDDARGLSPGVSGLLRFKAGLRQGFSVPDYAIVYKGSDTFVRVVENGKAKQLPVTLGRKSRGIVEITQGLYDNATLIERSSRFIADGEDVTVQKPDAGSSGTVQ